MFFPNKDQFVSPINLNGVHVPSEVAEDKDVTNSDICTCVWGMIHGYGSKVV